MRRRLAVISTIALALFLTAVPALAADGGASGGGDEDLTTGILFALIGGVIIGIIAFVDSTTGKNALDDLDHEVH